jgi:hypothetical protein
MLYLHEIPHKQGRASAARNFVAAAAGRGEGECWPRNQVRVEEQSGWGN